MAGEHHSESWDLKYREDEELEFFTELALHETERWIQVSSFILAGAKCDVLAFTSRCAEPPSRCSDIARSPPVTSPLALDSSDSRLL